MIREKSIHTSSTSQWFFEIVLVLYLMHDVPIIGLMTPAPMFAGLVLLLYASFCFYVGFRSFWSFFLRTVPLSLLLALDIIRTLVSSDGSFLVELYGYLQVTIYLIIGQHIFFADDSRLAKHLLFLLFIMYISTAITTLIGLQIYPEASRRLATSIASEDSVTYNIYRRYNIGGFSFIYTLVLFIPVLAGGIKNRIWNRVLTLVIAVLFFVVIVESEYTVALLLSLISFIVFFSPRQFNKRKSFVFLMITVFLVIIASSIIPTFLQFVSRNLYSDVLESRIDDVIIAISDRSKIGNMGGGSDLDARYMLMQQSWDSFLSAPLTGTWDTKTIGGHSCFLDTIALYGFLGIVCYSLFWVSLYRLYWKKNERCSWFGFFLFAFLLSIIMSILNPHVFYTYLGFYVPVFMVVFQNKRYDYSTKK